MKSLFTVLACLLLAGYAYGRDEGYALQCSPIGTGAPQLVSFLETDVNKNARYLETASGTFWDTHEWEPEKFTVRSFMQKNSDDEPILVSYIEVERTTLSASFIVPADPSRSTLMQCQQATARVSNKGINLSFDHLRHNTRE